MVLTDKEKDILQCWLDSWAKSDGQELHGHISYQDVDNLRIKLQLESPAGLTQIMAEVGRIAGNPPSDPWKHVMLDPAYAGLAGNLFHPRD